MNDQPDTMTLKILLPFAVHTEQAGVKRIVVETRSGSFGMLPHRLDCVGALVPGIFCYETEEEGERFLAVDEGILIKTGTDVIVSVRNAIGGTDLGALNEAVRREFLQLSEQESEVRSMLIKMETHFIRQFQELKRL